MLESIETSKWNGRAPGFSGLRGAGQSKQQSSTMVSSAPQPTRVLLISQDAENQGCNFISTPTSDPLHNTAITSAIPSCLLANSAFLVIAFLVMDDDCGCLWMVMLAKYNDASY